MVVSEHPKSPFSFAISRFRSAWHRVEERPAKFPTEKIVKTTRNIEMKRLNASAPAGLEV